MRFKISAARMTRALNNKKGFTLVELLIALVILSIVLAMMYQFFGFSNNMFKKTDDLRTKQDQARLIVQELRKDLGTALSVSIVDSDLDTIDAPADSYALYVKDDQLVREDDTGAYKPIYSSAPVRNFKIVFSSTDPAVVHVTISQEGVGTPIATTDIYLENTTANISSSTEGTGNIVVFTPSLLE